MVFGGHPLERGIHSASMVIWTTTPWTLPSNLAVAVGTDLDYVIASRADEAAFLRERGYAVSEQTTSYSVNSGLWGVTIGGRETTGTVESLPEQAWERTRGAFDQPRAPQRHTVGFAHLSPVRCPDVACRTENADANLIVAHARYTLGAGLFAG